MMNCGLLGRHLTHSYSPRIHAMLGDYTYELFEREPEELELFLKNGTWDALNVTVPYKKAVIPFLDELTPVAQRLGAVNTIVRRDGRLLGHNTDYFGFQVLLDALSLSIYGQKVLILGSGGSSNTAAAVLTDRGARVVIVSRTGEHNYENLHLHQDACLIVNTTPVGMYPHVGESPIPDPEIRKNFPDLKGVVDLIYNPARTQLLLDAESVGGVTAANGLLMLAAQAKEAAEWFTGSAIPHEIIGQMMNTLESELENLVLIGMPGCGKTTVGRLLAVHTGRKFVDTDEEIVKLARKSIPDIFAQDGEEAFRNLETKVLANFGKETGLVIATGGGCVTRERNYRLLHQNGKIFWLQRTLSALPTEGRPLSGVYSPEEMYRIRAPLYDWFRDWVIENDADPMDAVMQIMQNLEV